MSYDSQKNSLADLTQFKNLINLGEETLTLQHRSVVAIGEAQDLHRLGVIKEPRIFEMLNYTDEQRQGNLQPLTFHPTTNLSRKLFFDEESSENRANRKKSTQT